jgi:hypothetical protein
MQLTTNAADGSTTGPKIYTHRSGDEKARCQNFWDVNSLQKFASVHAPIHNHFNLKRHINRRETFKKINLPRCPNGVSLLPEIPRLQVLQARSS